MDNKFLDIELVDVEDIPRIPLYMDQVTGYLDEIFEDFKREDNEKILTKTMINNYVKAGIISSPEKKKYGKEQIMSMMMVYLLKNTVSIKEIEAIIKDQDIQALYKETIEGHRKAKVYLQAFMNEREGEADLDQILNLLLTANLFKRMAESMIDQLGE